MTNDHWPNGRSRGPVCLFTWNAPSHWTPLDLQNWLVARTWVFDASGSSGGFSSLLTKSPVLIAPAWKVYTPPARNQQWAPLRTGNAEQSPGWPMTMLLGR